MVGSVYGQMHRDQDKLNFQPSDLLFNTIGLNHRIGAVNGKGVPGLGGKVTSMGQKIGGSARVGVLHQCA
jgi:hypothetical protein